MAQIGDRSDFNVGQDVSVTIKSDNGDSFSAEELGILEDINIQIKRSNISVPAISHKGRTLSKSVPKNYHGKLVFVRYNDKLAKMQLKADKRYRDTKKATFYTVAVKVENADNTVSNYLCRMASSGDAVLLDAKQDKPVGQEFSFECPDLEEV